MKIALASDVHLEFGDIDLRNTENAEVLILSGDICVAADINGRVTNFFERCSRNFPNVIYIMGNHEHYHGDYSNSATLIREMIEFGEMNNVYFLDKESKTINDVTFIGGTLWTDMNKEDPRTIFDIRQMMNDYQCVRNGDERFEPINSIVDHKMMIEFIRSTIKKNVNGKFVVVGHHSPSKLSTHPRYADEFIVNGAYSSDLSEFIMDHPQIKLWTHGHTHETFDYMIGETRILCNPRGYHKYEQRAKDFKLLFTEI